MRRKFMAWLLTFAMLVTMMPTSVFADTTSGETTSPYRVINPEPISADDNGGLYLSKSLSDLTPAGEGTITLETYVQGSVNTSSVPLDIVLVLDQSGSMEEKITTPATYQQMTGRNSDFWAVQNELYVKNGEQYVKVTLTRKGNRYIGYTYTYTYGSNSVVSAGSSSTPDITLYRYYSGTQSKLSALKSSVTSFTASVAERNEDIENAADKHRIAIVGFASKNNYGYNTEILTIAGNNSGSVGKKYNDLTTDDYKNALVDADATIVTTAIDALDAEGATGTHYGMEMAQKIIANNPVPADSNRKQIVIMFTDGVPTTQTQFSTDVANSTINYANQIKTTKSANGNNVDVYTIGLFATGYNKDYSDNTNRFMNYTSSNYPVAVNMSTPGTGEWGGKYYQVAEDAASLDQIFQTISNDVQSIKLDETTIIKDVLSANFDLGTEVDADDINVYVSDYIGNGNFGDRQPVDYNVVIEGETVKVNGFDFEPVIDKADGNHTGKKLIIEVPVKIDQDQALIDAGKTVNSNNTTAAIASVDNTEGQSWAFPIPQVTLPPTVEVEVAKSWDDAGDQDGIRPDSVTVKLYADGEDTGKTIALSESNGWTAKFDNLRKYNTVNGAEIVYTVVETVPAGYTAEYKDANAIQSAVGKPDWTIVNKHTPEVTSISGSKTWDDADNQDGKRPGSIKVNLLANGEVVDSKTVKEVDNRWSWTFDNLPKYKEGTAINYSVTEDVIDDYSAAINGYNVVNTHAPEKTSVTVTKAWADADDQDGIRPATATVKLKANGNDTDKTVTLAEANNWTGSFTELDKYADGAEIVYTVEEVEIDGYTPVIAGDATKGFTVTNTHTPEVTSVSGSKTWIDNNDQDGARPDQITVNLLADGTKIDSETVTAEDQWSWSFTDLPKYRDQGVEIVYTVTEDAVDGYASETTGYDIVNTHTPEQTSVSVTKAWADANDQDGIRAESVTVKLKANGNDTGKTVTLAEANKWTGSFTELDKYADGEEIVYTVEEVEVDGYVSTVTGNATEGYVITNAHTPAVTSVSGSKTWDDADNQDGKRPEEITVNLLADGTKIDSETVTAEDQWSWSFTDLPKYRNQGTEIVYTVTEDAVENYTTSKDGYNFTNAYTPEETSITVTKAWVDADDQDGIRPDDITVNLLADGEVKSTATLSEENDWEETFTGLDVYKNGQEITYTIEEVAVEGYKSIIVGDKTVGFTVTNTHEVEKTEVPVNKVWNDADNQDGMRTASVVVELFADGESTGKTVVLNDSNEWNSKFENLDVNKDGEKINYTVREQSVEGYKASIEGSAANGYEITNTHEVEKISVEGSKTWNDKNNQDGKRPVSITVNLLADGEIVDTKTVTETENWAWSFTAPKYAEGKVGETIEYTVTEEVVEDYTTLVTGFDITNTHEVEKVSVEGSKTWVDDSDRDGLRPESIVVNLLADGEVVDTKTVTEADKWSWSFTNLDKFANGKEIVYTISEETVEGYDSEVNGYNITNTHEIETVDVTGSKTWVDADNQDGKRPAEITVNLLADGEVIDTVTASEAAQWSWCFTNLPKYRDQGTEIEYTIAEESVEGYEAKVDGFNITNTHTPETTKVEGEKIWKDKDDQDGDRPDSITVRLLADGEEISSKAVTEEDGWAWSFTDLPKYKLQGVEIVYTVIEDTVNEYSTTYDKYDVINTHTPDQTSVTVVKEWDDEGDQDGIRPDAVTVQLMADGTAVKGKTLELNEDNNWTGSFTELDKYRAKGTEIVYTVEELEVEGYETEITGSAAEGFKITNKHETATVEAEGKKVWKDNNDQDGVRPESITVKLLADGVEVDSKTVTAEDDWAWKFTDLPKHKEHGKEIEYSFAEITVEKYDTSIEGNVITNTHKIAKTEVDVIKIWNDEDDQDGIRPDSVTVQLMADGKAVEGKTLELSNSNRWRGTFEGLDKYRDKGTEIVYTVEELEVEGYTVEITGSAEDGYKVTNTHKPATVDVEGKKVWKDNDDQDGVRPESITVKLLADDKEIDSKTVTAEDGWAWKFTDLPKYKAQGTEIEYSFAEIAVDNYTTTVEGNVITNTYEVVKTEVKVAKVWNDADDQDGLRPDSVTVELYADGKATGKTQTLSDKNEWKAVFEDLNKYRDKGIEIAYTVEEVDVPEGYTKAVTGNAEVGFTVINSYTPEITAVKGKKVWNDNSDQDGMRPDTITVRLLADGKEVAEQTVSGSDDTWSYVFNDLPVYRDHGEKIVYTVSEDKVDEYSVKIDGTTIINTHEIEKTSAKGSKTWDDANNQDGVRPEAIVVNLLANGEIVDTVEVTEADNWSWEFTNLDKYDNGEEIVYSFSEEVVDDYSVSYDNNTIINTYAPEKTSVTVSKTWNDENDRDGIRPDSVTVVLLADGVETNKTVELSDDNNWIASFENLDKYRDQGLEIEYTVTEVAVDGYDAAITGTAETGFNIENTHEPDKTSISGNKTWDDADDQDGKRPFEITVNLLANGVEIDQVVVGADDNWSWKFDDLYVYENGKEIIYTVEEDIIEGYTSVVNGYDITNTHEIELTELTITKGWLDEKKRDRPDSITVNVLADGEVCRTVVITEENGWACTVTDLPKYVEGMVGVEVVYSVEEIAVEGYTTEIAGFDITNIKIPPQVTPEPPTDDGGEDDGDNNNNETKTGDNMNIFALAGTALASIAAAFAAIFRRKRNA